MNISKLFKDDLRRILLTVVTICFVATQAIPMQVLAADPAAPDPAAAANPAGADSAAAAAAVGDQYTDNDQAVRYNYPYYEKQHTCTTAGVSGASTGGDLYGLKFPAVADKADLSQAINKYIQKTNPRSPFLNLGDKFVSLGEKYGFNPLQAVAQAQVESGLGTSPYAKQYNNAFGLGGSSAIQYSKIEDSIEAYYKILKGGYSNFTTLAEFIHKYAPNGDGANNEAEYVKNIKDIEKQIIGYMANSGDSTQARAKTNSTVALLSNLIPAAQAQGATVPTGVPGLGDELDGHYIPAKQGGTGEEGDDVNYAFGAAKSAEETAWHMNMRWRTVKWYWDGNSLPGGPEKGDDFFTKHPKVLITNPKTKKNAVFVVLESGPAPWTGVDGNPNNSPKQGWTNPQDGTPDSYKGRVSGIMGSAMKYLGVQQRMADGSGDDLLYAWAPDQNMKLGPTDVSVGTSVADGGCNASSAAEAGDANFKKLNSFPSLTETINPTMLVLHFSETPTSQGIKGLTSALKTNPSCPGGCAVQVGIDADGIIYQLTKTLDTKGAHVYNFNDAAIGIEIIGMNERELLANEKQYNAVVSASLYIIKKYNIQIKPDLAKKKGVVSHEEADLYSDAHGLKSDLHDDPGKTYTNKVRDALKQELGQ